MGAVLSAALDLFVSSRMSRPFWKLDFYASSRGWADEAGNILVERMKAEAPVSTDWGDPRKTHGGLRDSIASETDTGVGGASVKITAVGYARFVVNSTRPHEITGSPLSFYLGDGGDPHFATVVEHPGTKANPFHRRVYEASREEIVGMLRSAVVRSLGA